MADQSDVETALVELVSNALYPDDPHDGGALSVVCRVYRGWPSGAALDADLLAGIVNVSVFPLPGHQRNTTRFPDVWCSETQAPGLRACVVGDAVTLSGRVQAGQVVGLLIDGMPLRYAAVPSDTPRDVALALIDALGPGRIALLLDATIRFPGVQSLVARVVRNTLAVKEIRRQTQAFRLSFWCPDPNIRDQVVALADLSLAGQSFIELPDRSSAKLRFLRSETIDKASDAHLFRRDLIYEAEFATILYEMQPALLFGDLGVNGEGDRVV